MAKLRRSSDRWMGGRLNALFAKDVLSDTELTIFQEINHLVTVCSKTWESRFVSMRSRSFFTKDYLQWKKDDRTQWAWRSFWISLLLHFSTLWGSCAATIQPFYEQMVCGKYKKPRSSELVSTGFQLVNGRLQGFCVDPLQQIGQKRGLARFRTLRKSLSAWGNLSSLKDYSFAPTTTIRHIC